MRCKKTQDKVDAYYVLSCSVVLAKKISCHCTINHKELYKQQLNFLFKKNNSSIWIENTCNANMLVY